VLERTQQIATAAANAAHDDLMQLNLELFSFDPFADRIWQLRHTVTSCGAWYAALAEALKLPHATLDEKLSKATGPPATSSHRAGHNISCAVLILPLLAQIGVAQLLARLLGMPVSNRLIPLGWKSRRVMRVRPIFPNLAGEHDARRRKGKIVVRR
jgi:hypothetical protein